MIKFKTTTRMFIVNRSTGEQFECRNKAVLGAYLGISGLTVMDMFRKVNGVKPKNIRYKEYEIFDIDGEYYKSNKPWK